eukprot:519958-Amphidinium_carterae.1
MKQSFRLGCQCSNMFYNILQKPLHPSSLRGELTKLVSKPPSKLGTRQTPYTVNTVALAR